MNKAFEGYGIVSPLDGGGGEESEDEGWEEREASRTHSVKFTDDVESETGKEVWQFYDKWFFI